MTTITQNEAYCRETEDLLVCGSCKSNAECSDGRLCTESGICDQSNNSLELSMTVWGVTILSTLICAVLMFCVCIRYKRNRSYKRKSFPVDS